MSEIHVQEGPEVRAWQGTDYSQPDGRCDQNGRTGEYAQLAADDMKKQ